LRQRLRRQFEESFGNQGLRTGTVVLRAGHTGGKLDLASWNELLPAIAKDLATQCSYQIRVRCGVFNEWQPRFGSPKIGEIVDRILRFDDNPPWHEAFLGFGETTQEAAVVDGVLVENSFYRQHALSQKWELLAVDKDCPYEALREVFQHFTTGGSGEKE